MSGEHPGDDQAQPWFDRPYGRRPLYYDIDGNPIDESQARDLRRDIDARRVALTVVGATRVSTVHLVIDHGVCGEPPLIFETMVLSEDEELDEKRVQTSTKVAALAAHDQMVALVRHADRMR